MQALLVHPGRALAACSGQVRGARKASTHSGRWAPRPSANNTFVPRGVAAEAEMAEEREEIARPRGQPFRPFALETCSNDGQGWAADELSSMLVGVSMSTPRARVQTTALLGYSGGLLEGSLTPNKASRCEKLEVDLCFEATAKGAEGVPLTGLARVTMSKDDRTDTVRINDVHIRVPEGSPQPEARVMRDVEYAVQSLDSAIMDRLNNFLWDVESHNANSAASASM